MCPSGRAKRNVPKGSADEKVENEKVAERIKREKSAWVVVWLQPRFLRPPSSSKATRKAEPGIARRLFFVAVGFRPVNSLRKNTLGDPIYGTPLRIFHIPADLTFRPDPSDVH